MSRTISVGQTSQQNNDIRHQPFLCCCHWHGVSLSDFSSLEGRSSTLVSAVLHLSTMLQTSFPSHLQLNSSLRAPVLYPSGRPMADHPGIYTSSRGYHSSCCKHNKEVQIPGNKWQISSLLAFGKRSQRFRHRHLRRVNQAHGIRVCSNGVISDRC